MAAMADGPADSRNRKTPAGDRRGFLNSLIKRSPVLLSRLALDEGDGEKGLAVEHIFRRGHALDHLEAARRDRAFHAIALFRHFAAVKFESGGGEFARQDRDAFGVVRHGSPSCAGRRGRLPCCGAVLARPDEKSISAPARRLAIEAEAARP